MNHKTLIVFTNARNIRDFEQSFGDGFLPKIITFAEFIKRCFYLPNLARCDDMTQIILMQDAVKQTKKATSVLGFASEFYEFMKNSEYLFSFFKELATGKKSIADLKNSDIYADYDEHLVILEELFKAYSCELASHGLYDDITACLDYQINELYVQEFDDIILQIDGFITEFEFEILCQIRHLCRVIVELNVSELNHKITSKIGSFLDLELESGFRYEIDFSVGEIINKSALKCAPKVMSRGFALRSMQCAYVFEKISSFIDSGIEPQKIAVILPDESFAPLLRVHDSHNLLNFAIGQSFTTTLFYEIFSKITAALKDNQEPFFDENYLDSAPYFEKYGLFFANCGVKKELFDKFRINFKNKTSYSEFYGLYSEVLSLCITEKFDVGRLSKLLEKPLFDLELLLDKFSFSLEQICDIFLNIIAQVRIDHVGGGAISVIGLLESRGMSYDGVVIVDFNDDLVPKRAVNEMFLNSKIREKTGLISYQDRENLQKFYYESLIAKAKKCAISYCISEEKLPSRFLSHFECFDDEIYSDDEYLALFAKEPKIALCVGDEEPLLDHDFFQNELSFSRLDTFLSCKRKYFYRYIKYIKEPKLFGETPNPALQGNIIHQALSQMYQKSAKFDLEILSEIYLNLAKNSGLNELESEFELLRFARLEKIIKEHESSGWSMLESESEESTRRAEFCGVKIVGKIDRIDVNGGEKMIIDYKRGQAQSGSYQLAFYEALLGGECESCFLSLKQMKFVKSTKSISDLALLIEELKDKFTHKVSFERALTSAPCRYCPYILICKRGE